MALTDHFANAFVRKTFRASMTLWRRNGVRKVDTDAILFGEIQCKKSGSLLFKRRFQCCLGWNQIKYARIIITNVCFMVVFKQCLRDQANVNV